MSVATISPRQAPSGIRWAVKPVRPGAGIVRRADGPVPDVLFSGVRCRSGQLIERRDIKAVSDYAQLSAKIANWQPPMLPGMTLGRPARLHRMPPGAFLKRRISIWLRIIGLQCSSPAVCKSNMEAHWLAIGALKNLNFDLFVGRLLDVFRAYGCLGLSKKLHHQSEMC